jgi:hypothetical protein
MKSQLFYVYVPPRISTRSEASSCRDCDAYLSEKLNCSSDRLAFRKFKGGTEIRRRKEK